MRGVIQGCQQIKAFCYFGRCGALALRFGVAALIINAYIAIMEQIQIKTKIEGKQYTQNAVVITQNNARKQVIAAAKAIRLYRVSKDKFATVEGRGFYNAWLNIYIATQPSTEQIKALEKETSELLK